MKAVEIDLSHGRLYKLQVSDNELTNETAMSGIGVCLKVTKRVHE